MTRLTVELSSTYGLDRHSWRATYCSSAPASMPSIMEPISRSALMGCQLTSCSGSGHLRRSRAVPHGRTEYPPAKAESNIGPTLSVVELPQHREEVDSKLDQAREHLLTLRRQQEELERQKSELEELRRKQEEYSRGRAEITDNMARGLPTVDP